MTRAYNAPMLRTHNTIPIRFSPRQHARLWFAMAVVFFVLAAGSYYWNEGAQYRTYLGIGLVLVVLGFLPLLVSAFQRKSE
jgi:hypothetical protein